jgi:tetratricopeptide (TPR) repeat protein
MGFNRLQHEMDLPAAAKLFEKALALEPGNAIVLANAAALAMTLGRIEEAVILRELAQQLNPLSSGLSAGLGSSYLVDGQPDKAEAAFRKALLLSPNRPGTRAALVRVLARKGDLHNLEEVWDLIAEEPREPLRLIATASTHYKLGNTAEADTALETLIEKYSRKTGSLIALAYAIRGETDNALKWLQQAVEFEGPQALMNSWYAAEFEILHGDPRWEKMLTNAGFSKQQLAAIDFKFTLPEYE